MSKRRREKDTPEPGIKVPASCSGITSESRNVQRLRRENEALRKELVEVLANALENEKIWRHFAAVERILFRTRELDRLIEELLREIKDRFQTGLLEQLGINIALSMENCLTYEKVRDFTVKDQLTGLFNFFQIHTILEKEFRKARRSGSALSVLVVDLNFLHDWDQFESGMEVLKHAARLMEAILPKEGCFMGRYGSDEFLIILPGVPEEEAREVMPYISSTMRKSPYLEGNTAILITIAIGVGSLNERATVAQDLVDAAYSELCAVKLRHGPKGE